MNILELCLSPDYGGLEIHMRDFSRWMTTKNEAALYLALQENSHLSKELADLKVPTLSFSNKAAKFAPMKAHKLSKFIQENNIDLVHVHWKYDLPLVALTKIFCKRSFKFVHTRQMNMPGKKFDPYHHFIYGKMDKFIAITKYIEKQAKENLPIAKEKIIQIYYGVKVPEYVSRQCTDKLKQELNIKGDFVVGLLGRISEYKGQHLLIEAIEILKKENVKIYAWIVGSTFEPDYFSRLKKMVVEKELINQIHFMDFYENPIELMRCFDTVVLTTRNETFGLVLIEAMHAGVPVVGSNAGGVPEIIDHGETGLLFESGNAQDLAASLKKLYYNKALCKHIASSGKQKALQLFDLDKQYGKVLEIFDRLHSSK